MLNPDPACTGGVWYLRPFTPSPFRPSRLEWRRGLRQKDVRQGRTPCRTFFLGGFPNMWRAELERARSAWGPLRRLSTLAAGDREKEDATVCGCHFGDSPCMWRAELENKHVARRGCCRGFPRWLQAIAKRGCRGGWIPFWRLSMHMQGRLNRAAPHGSRFRGFRSWQRVSVRRGCRKDAISDTSLLCAE